MTTGAAPTFIDNLLSEWEKDSVIDDDHLDKSAIKTSSLHSKYLGYLISNKSKISKVNFDMKLLRAKKIKYYKGEMTKEELIEAGWTQWQGVKPIKSEMEELLQGDMDIARLQSRIEYYESIGILLDSIMNQLKSRDWQIRNAINWKQFIAGN